MIPENILDTELIANENNIIPIIFNSQIKYQEVEKKVWSTTLGITINVSVDYGFIKLTPKVHNPLIKQLILNELDSIGIYNLILRKLIPSSDYNPYTHKGKLKYR